MAGYDGFSMSNNATKAYEAGEKPLSKWSKNHIIEAVEEIADLKFNISLLKKVKLDILKGQLLSRSSWHHTSKHFNRTDFYSLDIDTVEDLTDAVINEWKKAKTVVKTEEVSEKWECEYLEWEGSKKHPVATKHVAVGEIKGNWFVLPSGRKKSINANGFRKLKECKNA